MADEVWKIREDGYLDLNVDCNSITYHPNLNIVLLLSKSSEVLVIDVNSGLLLQKSFLSANHNGKLQATYVAGHDKILFVDERGVGVRTDYNGVLLLDTILQTPVSNPDDIVRVELLFSEAMLLGQTLQAMDLPGIEHKAEVCQALTKQLAKGTARMKKGNKAQKWNTVCLELPHNYLKWVCSGLVSELKRQNRHVPALAIASAVHERLNSLLPLFHGSSVDRSLMFSEAMRRKTFSKWPHMNYKWALPDQMAQAGFYHQPNSSGDDRAMCFTCIVCLVCWEPADEPWSEHERHSPSCPFVKGEYTQNVPLSVTYATAPAVKTKYAMEILGTSSVQELIPTASVNGYVTIWNCSRQLKTEATVLIANQSKCFCDYFRKKAAWADQEVVEIPLTEGTLENIASGDWNAGLPELRVGAVSVVGGPSKRRADSDSTSPCSAIRPVLVAGTIEQNGSSCSVSSHVRVMNSVNQASSALHIMKVAESKNQEWRIHLIVYDFHYQTELSSGEGGESSASKTLVSGTGTSASRQENCSVYQDIFLSKFLYTGPALHDVESEMVYQQGEFIVGENFPAPSSSSVVSGISCPVPLGVAVPTAGGGTFDTSMAINEGLDMTNFPSTSNESPPLVAKLLDRDSKSELVSELSNVDNSILAQEPIRIQSVLVDTCGHDLRISGLHPTRDGKHILVVLGSASGSTLKPCGMLILYRLDLSGPAVKLEENPVCVKVIEQEIVSLTMLPLEGELLTNPLGMVAIIMKDGLLSLIDIASLETKASTSHQEGSKFVSVTYCNSLERICAASEKGSLHFFSLHDEDLYKSEESIFADNVENYFYTPKQSTAKETPLLANATKLDLTALYELTRFENLVPCFAATVPACWSELMQAQKQRRHPQHLQHADDVNHTRSWRLQNDLKSWDEHVFELTLPRSVCVGHVDLKFFLQAQCSMPPNIQFTLLKQNASGIGRMPDSSMDVDASVDFNISPDSSSKIGAEVNPVLTEEFARAHNTEILCGPVSLASCLDLTDQSGTVTFSSPKLFKVRGRTLLVHIKALANQPCTGLERDRRFQFGLGGSLWDCNGLYIPGSAVDRVASNMTTKKTELNGCDWLHEISITIRKTKETEIPNERTERCAMLESENFVERLIELVSTETGVQQNMAFDILLWLATIRLGRVHPTPSSQLTFLSTVSLHLPQLFRSCFILGDRTSARKCVKLTVLCSDSVKNFEDSESVQFDTVAVMALLETLPQVPSCWSAGALRWFFALLSRLVTVETVSQVTNRALDLLKQVARNLHARQNPNHLLLQTRFGLYGTPFEAELFDQEPPILAKFSSTPLGYTKVVSSDPVWNVGVVNMINSSQNTTVTESGPGAEDLRDLLNMKGKSKVGEGETRSSLSQLRCLTANHYMKGLLEVQPLHFTCHATSDGTKLEKMDSGGAGAPVVNYFDAPPISPISPILTNHVASNGPKKVAENDMERVPWQQLVTPPPQHALVVERMHSGARRFAVLDLGCPVLLTDLFVPACPDLLSLSIDLWTLSEDQDAQRLVVAPDITTKTLIMNDIHPPPVVRFIKITTIGRYGMNTTKCKIPIGCFYGHLLILPGEDYAEKKNNCVNYPNPQNQLSVLNALFEDIQCRYTLACTKLQDLLSPLLTAEIANISHMHHYLRRNSDALKSASSKITTAYQECVIYQHQLNSVRSVTRRLCAPKSTTNPQNSLTSACTDKLRVLGENLLDLMLYLAYDVTTLPNSILYSLYQNFDQPLCEEMFNWLCVAEDTRMQLSACTLLVRMSGLQPWWGDFLVSTLTKLYSSHQTSIFPQDRVFILLVYLGRKSLSGGASRSTVIDSVLKTLLQQLTPLALSSPAPGPLRSHMDLPLIGWLLLFLSQCLDSTALISGDDTQDKMKNEREVLGTGSRWDFLQGELSISRRMSAVSRSNNGKGYRRRLQKKLMHHKQQLEDLEVAKKAFQASTQVSGLPQLLKTKALSALSSQAAKLSYKLETALKQQEQFLKKSVKQQASTSMMSKELGESRRTGKDTASPSSSKPRASPSENNVLCLPRAHCLPVARALIALLLHMDFTCNLDTFLLTCKVVARVALWSRPNLLLGEVMDEEQLLSLIRLAVYNDQRHSSWGSPWACHAITCLLQDLLEGGRLKRPSPEPTPIEEEPEMDISREEDIQTSSEINDMEEGVIQIPEPEDPSSPGMPSIKIKINSTFSLPSLLESDDSELEDLLDDILERGRSLTKKHSTIPRVPLGIASNVSTALDSRLEYSVDGNTEVTVRRMTAHGAYNLPMSVSAPITGLPNHAGSSGTNHPPLTKWEDNLTSSWQPANSDKTPSSVVMLESCFAKIFLDLTDKDSNINVELVLQLWLTLNLDNPLGSSDSRVFDASIVPSIALTNAAVTALISVLANKSNNTVRCWCLAFQTLTLVSNLSADDSLMRSGVCMIPKDMLSIIIDDQNFNKLLLAFFSSSQIKGCAGVSVCQCLHDFIVRLMTHCDVVTSNSYYGAIFKKILLTIFEELVRPGTGAIPLKQGPLDAHLKLVQLMLNLNFLYVNVNVVVSILKAVGLLVHSHMMNGESVWWRNIMEPNLTPCYLSSTSSSASNNTTTNNNSSGVSGKPRLASWELLLISVVRLATNMAQIPLEPGVTSQTDELKAASNRKPCVADTVLQDEHTMHCLLSALEVSSTAVLADNQEPSSVGQVVFQFLSTLARKATLPKFILKPVFTYISGNNRSLSEPLLSLLLRVIDSPEALQEFTSLGALEVVCENLVKANRGMVNCQPSTVSIVMQHLSQTPLFAVKHNLKTQLTRISTSKSSLVSDTMSGLLINFAPLGTISSSNPTAQPADVLIQAAPPHRRARSPAWSYHFYPDESWVELTLTLPCAVLLKEVHLQPHLTSLATCPSVVGLEISRDGRSPMVPVSLPLDSSGLTFIRMHLPQPEVVTSVLLRLYKPRDSSNIGLSQIRLLGNTTFNNSTNLQGEDEEFSIDSSLGWMRLLHHCLTVNTEPVVSACVKVPGLLQACCTLLLVPAPSPLTPCLEHVLYTLGTHQPELGLGLQIITTLLSNASSQFFQDGLSNGVDSVVELLYMLCSTQDSHTEERVKAILSWLTVTAAQAHIASCKYVQCVAAILWANPALSHLVTNDLFSLVYQWTLKLESRSALKRSVDIVLCAMCYIKPMLFPMLLQRMGALVPIVATGHSASISDDRKDSEGASMTDDNKKEEQEMSEWYNQLVLQDLQNLYLSDSQLMTIALACQSPPVTMQLLDSGLPNLLTNAILDFCTRKHTEKKSSKQSSQSRLTDSDKASGRNHVIKEGSRPMVQLEMITSILKFFAEVCSEGVMRDWLGSSKGSEFWIPLLTMLCNRPQNSRCEMMSESVSALELATVKFLSRCCWCHPSNQKLLATVLCDIISQQKTQGELGISGVTRRLILQLLLESEKISVCVRGSSGMRAEDCGPIHPRHGVGHNSHLFYVSVHSTCADIIRLVSSSTNTVPDKVNENCSSKESVRESLWSEVSEQLFVAAGVTAKDKRIKDAKNVAASLLKDKASSVLGKKSGSFCPSVSEGFGNNEGLQHQELPTCVLPSNLTLSQLLTVLDQRGVSLSTPCIELTISQLQNREGMEITDALLLMPAFRSPLQVFTQQGGLALLAEHLPLVYPETLLFFRSSTAPVTLQAADQVDADWVKVEASDDIYEDLEVSMGAPYSNEQGVTVSKHSEVVVPSVPYHSLAAFGLFLRLPGYAEVLLKDKRKAQCLLRLVLGVSDDGEGGEILSNPVSSALPTLPFEVLRQLLDSTPLSTDDGVLLRRTALDCFALHLLLSCLSVFTHQPLDSALPSLTNPMKSSPQSRSKSDDKSHLYWAKGTGFGTGSTTQSWNVEQALSRQRSEEQHVTVLLQVLSSYINPGGLVTVESSDEDSDTPTKPVPPQLPPCIHDLLLQSCLLPALSSYLRNDSVLDMARHIPLYRSVLQLMRAIAQNSQLVSLLLPKAKQPSLQLSAVCLLQKMKNVVDTYASRLKINKPKNPKKIVRISSKQHEENLESDEGLALLIPDIQETANLVQSATEKLIYESESDSESGMTQDLDSPMRKSLEERYLEVMKPLQFETYEMITELSEGNGFQFVVSYHFESNVRSGGDRSHPARVKRLAQETVTLSTSLPLSFSSSVFVRCDADRLDIMKVLITGPAETPYANGCFELDVYFPPDYPNSPMLINLETTGHHTIRFNPNLYNDGKVCLSVLNTWHGRPEEKWNAHTSSFLQVLVSIQSLILVPEPYFNEPGYERSRGTQAGNQSSREYNSNICQATVKWAMLEQLRNPSPCFKQIIQTHFWMKRKEIKSQIEAWIADMESQASDRRTGRTISLNTMALKRHYLQLCEELAKLKPPPGLEDLADPEEPTWQQDMEKIVSEVCE